MLNERLLGVLSTKENVNLLTLGFSGGSERKFKALIAPVDIAGERLGTLFIYKCVADYDIDDIILCEYGATVVGLEMMSSVNNENAEDERKKKIVKSAIKTLSASELQAVKAVFAHMDGMDDILVASRIADDTGITRSVIVNALKKFDSAGVISTKSSGMKGTKIKVLNEVVYDPRADRHAGPRRRTGVPPHGDQPLAAQARTGRKAGLRRGRPAPIHPQGTRGNAHAL